MNNSDKAIEILQLTSDGDLLAPKHLHLIQEAVNGNLSEIGQTVFDNLHSQVSTGKYDRTKVYYYDVEFMTKDHQGYIYFKGKTVEHFTYKDSKEELKKLLELQRICLLLEQKGIEVSTSTAVFHVEQYLTPEELSPTTLPA